MIEPDYVVHLEKRVSELEHRLDEAVRLCRWLDRRPMLDLGPIGRSMVKDILQKANES